MKIYFENLAKGNIRNILRRCGYAEIFDRLGGKISYVRRLGTYFYPRFHIYAEETENGLAINLHLDQKKASYRGQVAHSGEYDEAIVKEEAERIREKIKISN